MPRIRIFPYKVGSKSVKALKESLGAKTLKVDQERSRFKPRDTDFIINWGSADCWLNAEIINRPEAIRGVVDKRVFLGRAANIDGLKVPETTLNKEVAKTWSQCVSRLKLTGSQGDGIVITKKGEEPPDAPLYVRYIQKQKEFRIHVAFGEIIDMQRKIRDPEREPDDWQVRNHANGFIFVRGSGDPTHESKEQALLAVKSFGLDFGAVDLIETKESGSYVLEINSAPALEGTTLEKYTNAFRRKALY